MSCRQPREIRKNIDVRPVQRRSIHNIYFLICGRPGVQRTRNHTCVIKFGSSVSRAAESTILLTTLPQSRIIDLFGIIADESNALHAKVFPPRPRRDQEVKQNDPWHLVVRPVNTYHGTIQHRKEFHCDTGNGRVWDRLLYSRGGECCMLLFDFLEERGAEADSLSCQEL